MMHAFPVITQKNYFESRIPLILSTSKRGRRSNLTFIINTLQRCYRRKWNSKYFLTKETFTTKRSHKKVKDFFG